jgi:hypothetical protein
MRGVASSTCIVVCLKAASSAWQRYGAFSVCSNLNAAYSCYVIIIFFPFPLSGQVSSCSSGSSSVTLIMVLT